MVITILSSTVKNGLEGEDVKQIVNIPSHNLQAFACFSDTKIRVFKSSAGVKPVYAFDNQYEFDFEIVNLPGDVVCSMAGAYNNKTRVQEKFWIASKVLRSSLNGISKSAALRLQRNATHWEIYTTQPAQSRSWT